MKPNSHRAIHKHFTAALLAGAVLLGAPLCSRAQPLSTSVHPGINFIANPFNNGGNSAAVIFPNPDPTQDYSGPHDNDEIRIWNCAGYIVYVFDSVTTDTTSGFVNQSGNPAPAPILTPGCGFVYVDNQGAPETLVFTGTAPTPVRPPPCNCGCGKLSLWSPQTTSSPHGYQDITGSAPAQGDQVLFPLITGSGGLAGFTTNTYSSGAWSPSTPTLTNGQSAFFYSPCCSNSVTVNLPPGFSLIGNPLDNGNNSAALLFPNPDPTQDYSGPRDGDELELWQCDQQGYVVYVFDSVTTDTTTGFTNPNGIPIPAPILTPGCGFLYLNNMGINESVVFTGCPPVAVYPPPCDCGCGKWSLWTPQTLNSPHSYQDVTGSAPQDGDAVSYGVSTMGVPIPTDTYSGGVWSPNTPSFTNGESAFFYRPCPTNCVVLYDTGVDDTNALLNPGSVDTHYTLINNPQGTGPQTYVIVNPTAAWIPNDASSQWIGPDSNGGNGISGEFDFETTFGVPCAGDVVITGQWAADNYGCIYLDTSTNPVPGTCIGSAGPTDHSGFNQWHPFTVSGNLSAGTHTLTFAVNNTGGPTGLRVEFLTVTGGCCTDCCANCTQPYPLSYTNSVPGGTSFLANNLCQGTNNTLDEILPNMPDSVELRTWDFVTQNFDNPQAYDAYGFVLPSPGWYDEGTLAPSTTTLSPGEGFIINNPNGPFQIVISGCEPTCPPPCEPPTNGLSLVGRLGIGTATWTNLFSCPPPCGARMSLWIGSGYSNYDFYRNAWHDLNGNVVAAPVLQIGLSAYVSIQSNSNCCPTVTNLVMNTGYNQNSNTVYNIGSADAFWWVTKDPTVPAATLPRPATVITPNGAWAAAQPNSRWISSYLTDIDDLNGEYDFQTYFCTATNATNLVLTICLRADDAAGAALNGHLITLPANTAFNAPTPACGTVVNPNWFVIGGQNVLTVFVTNTSNLAMGLNADVTVSGQGLVPVAADCCRPGSGLSGQKIYDLDCNGVLPSSEPALSGWTIQLSGPSSGTAVTDVNGYYYFNNLAPGTYTLTEVLQPGWTQSVPSSGTRTVTLGNMQQINGLNFGNCHTNNTNCVHIVCPTNITAHCTGNGGVALSYSVSAYSLCNSNDPVIVTCSPKSPHFFQVGVTTVNCTAQQDVTNWAKCSFTVTVIADPPTITCPTNIVLTSCTNVQVFYAPTVADACCGTNVTVSNSPPSGSFFVPGTTTTVISTARDCFNHTAVCSFTVTVNQGQLGFQNGDFSTFVPDNGTGGGWTSSDISTTPGWQPTGGNPGACFLLNEVGSTGANPTLSQTICCLSTGQCYTISWQTALQSYHNPNNLPSFGVFVNGLPVKTYNTDPNDLAWHQYAVNFTATNTCETISFEAELDPTDVSYYLDNVSIVPCCTNSVTNLVMNTGYNQNSNTVYAFNQPDAFWWVTKDPTIPAATLPRPATVIQPNPYWQNALPNSRWISSYPSDADDLDGEYDFNTYFCLSPNATNLVLNICLRADDAAAAALNGHLITLPADTTWGAPSPACGTVVQSLPVNAGWFVLGGQNVLTVYVTNIFEIAMGLNASVSLTGTGISPLGSPCCPFGSGLSGRKFFDMNCNGVQDPGEPGLSGWTIQLSGAATATAVTDVNGYYYFTNLAAGSYTVTEVPQSGWTQSAPAGGSYTVNLGNLQQLNGFNFGNCHTSSNCVHILCPSNIVTECTGYGGAFVDFNVSASSSCTTNPVHVTCYPPPKHFFTVGTTTVNCTAYDSQFNWTNCSFTVTVVDDLPPTITCPGNIVVSSCTNIQEFYAATATDLCCGTNVHITYNPLSGSYFAPGTTTTVICTATDCNSNSATCSFTVTVNPIPPSFQNGDFSQSVPSNGTGNGWTSSDIDVFGNDGWGPTNGNPGGGFLLNEHGSMGQNPTISQMVCCLSTGQCYTIFWQTRVQAYLSNPNNLPSFGVFVDGHLIYSSNAATNDTAWHQYSANFTATNACQTISFESEMDPTDVSYYLDNVSIVPCCTNSVTNLVMNTGYNQNSNTVYAFNQPDAFWWVTKDPTIPAATLPRPATVIQPNPYWQNALPNSRWISSYPSDADDLDGEYDFNTYFCLTPNATNLVLNICLRADDAAAAALNGHLITLPADTTWGAPSPACGTVVQSLPVNAGWFVLGGQNVLTVYVTNIFEIAMGLNASVSLTGSGIIPAGSPCCPIGSGLSGRKFFDMNCNGVQDPGEPGLAGWTIQMSGGATTQSAVTDVNGYYYFTNLVPGTYTVTEVPQSGWTQSAPPGGSYTVSLGNLQQINGLNFGNCHASSNCVHILCPSNIVTECTGYGGAFVDFNVSASSSCTTNPVHITCYPPPKHFFTIGTTTVNCTAYDAQYNWTNCSFTVTVVDDLPPTITCPSNIVVTSCTNIQEFYSASASDLCCGTNVHITYNPPSGSYFAPGTVTTVICTATDCNSNSATCSFTVTVNPIPASFQNGDFSTAVPSNGTGGGWTTSDLIGPPTGWQATGGNPGACFLLNEVGSQGQNPTISQTICCLSTGQCYKIRWQTKIQAYLSNPQGLPSFGVFVDGNLIYSYDGDSDDTSWHQYSASFVATNSCQTISFEAELDPTDVSYYLDNVTIAPCCTNTCSFVCAPDKTVYCPTNWTFDRPTLGTQSCCSNVVFTLVSSNTLVSNPCRSVYEGVWQGMDCCSNLMVCTQFVTAVKSGPPVLNPGIMLDYSTLPDAGINFAGGGFTFVGNASGFQFQIDDVSNGAGDSLGFNGYFTSSSAFSIGTITINGAMQSAPVTGSCVIHISDGVNELTGTVQWVDIATLGTSGVLNLNGVVNLTGIAYGGSSLDLQSLVASASGSIDMTFQFVPARTLTQLKNTGGFSDFSGSILGSPFLAPTAAVNCPTNKTVPCGTAWTFDLPQAAGSCCTNLTITVINTLTNKLTVPCATEYTRTWKITDCCTNTAICMQTVTVLHCVPPPAGMVAWWPGDGNTLDIAGGNNGTLQGNAGYGPGEVGQAFTFDGNNSWVQVPPSSTSTLNITGPVTIDAWVRFNSVNPNPGNGWPVVWKGNSSGYDPTSAYGLGVTGSNQLWGLVGNFSVSSEVYGPFLTQLGTWYHIALVADGTNLTLYANGAAVSSAPQTVSPYASPYPLVIGGIYNSPPNNWNGSIDEVEIFNRALSASQINTIYQAGAAGKCKTPELTCASPKTVVCGQSWSFNPPVVNDPCCGTNLAATPISTVTNGPCPITVTRTWLYMDCCGNSNLCSQVVTVINTNPPTITCSSNKTVECGSAWMFDPPTAFAPCCSNVVANSTNVGGSIFLTGHDPDFHAYIGGNKVGAQDINKRAIAFIMDPAFNPYWNKKFLFVEASITPPSGHTDGVNGIIASGYVQGTDFDRVDASGLNAALNQLGTTYGGIVVASDFGGILTQAELDILNARANDIANFVNSGGGLYAISESDNGAHLTPNGGWYKFVPVVTISTSFNQTETGNSVTAFGASLGLVNSDVNGNYSHAIFTSAAGLNAVDLDASGDMLSVAGRKVLLPPPNVTITVISTVTNFAGHCGKTFDATRTWMATDCCSNIATCSQKVTVVDTTPPIIGCSSNKTVNCGTAWSFDVPSVFAPCCSNSQVYVVGNGNGGRIYLTGHDPDFHANSGNTGNNFTGAQHINQAAISYIMNNPYVNVYGLHKFLFVESSITPPSGHIDGVIGIIDSGYAVNVDFDRADATTLNAKLNLLGSTYAGIVVASDYGGILTQAELDILNSRAADIANFVNSGGGLYAMAEADGGAGLTPNGGWYNFVPIVTTSAALNQPETGNTVTPFGASLGLVNSDINGNASHAIFLSAGGLNTVDLDPSSHILSVAGQNVVIPPPNNSLIVQLISSNLISGPCPQVWQGVWRAQDCCSNSITCTQLVTVLPSAPTLLCSNLTINCGSPIPTNRPAYIDPCCTNVVVSLVSSTTAGSLGASNSCTEIISQTWRAVDLCCNMTNTCVRTITVLGVPPPVITCPTNITIVTCSNNVIVTWSITATDLCSSVTAVSTPPSGSSFQLGTTNTVTVVATNICGTAATCTFPVILIAPGATISIKPGPGIGQVTITWLDGGILQQSNGLVQQSNGTWTFQPWVNVAGAMSPYTVPASSLQRYYRVLCP